MITAGLLADDGSSCAVCAPQNRPENSINPAICSNRLSILLSTFVTYACEFLSSRMRLNAQICHLPSGLELPLAGGGVRIRGGHSSQERKRHLGRSGPRYRCP